MKKPPKEMKHFAILAIVMIVAAAEAPDCKEAPQPSDPPAPKQRDEWCYSPGYATRILVDTFRFPVELIAHTFILVWEVLDGIVASTTLAKDLHEFAARCVA